MRRKKRERVSCKADILCPRCAPACKCAQAFPRIRHARVHVRGFVDPPRAKSRASGLEKGDRAPEGWAGGAARFAFFGVFSVPMSFRLRHLFGPDAFPAPMPFLPRCRSDSDVFSVPTFFWLRHLFGSDIFSVPASSRRGSAGLFEKNAEKVAKLGGYRVAKDLHGGSAVRRKLLSNQSIILNRQNAETGQGIRSMTPRPSMKVVAVRVRYRILR